MVSAQGGPLTAYSKPADCANDLGNASVTTNQAGQAKALAEPYCGGITGGTRNTKRICRLSAADHMNLVWPRIRDRPSSRVVGYGAVAAVGRWKNLRALRVCGTVRTREPRRLNASVTPRAIDRRARATTCFVGPTDD